jgi:phosphatidylinositol dimannoside acyltransferase
VKAPALRRPRGSSVDPIGLRTAPHRRPERGSRLVAKLAIVGYRSAAWLLWRLPPRISAEVLGRGAQLSYLLWPTKRAWSNANFGRVLGLPPGNPRVRRLALAAYRTYGRYVVELMRLPRLTREQILASVHEHQLEPIEPIWRESPGGLIITLAHVGNNETPAAAAGTRGWPMHVIADDSAFPELFELLNGYREAMGAKVIPWRNLRKIYGVLRDREILVMAIDWGYRADGIPVRLFGAWTTMPAGPATLAAKTGSRILHVAVRREPDGRYEVSFGTPISVPSTDPADLQHATQLIADALEATVAAAPEQWYSFKPMWPATDEEAADLARRASLMLGTAST